MPSNSQPKPSELLALEAFAASLGRANPAAPAIAAGKRVSRQATPERTMETVRVICAGAARGRMALARGEVVQAAMELGEELGCRAAVLQLAPGLLNMGKQTPIDEFTERYGKAEALAAHLCCVGGVLRRLGGGVPESLAGFYLDGQRVNGTVTHGGQVGHWI